MRFPCWMHRGNSRYESQRAVKRQALKSPKKAL
jgi:hypothetical protein